MAVMIPCEAFEYRERETYDHNFTRFHQQLNDERFEQKQLGAAGEWPVPVEEAKSIFRAQYGMNALISRFKFGEESTRTVWF